MDKKQISFNRKCIVPMCKTTTRTAPDKVFFYSPRDPVVREKWCKAMGIDNLSQFSCCEDHFDIEEDTENYMRYNIMALLEGYKVTLRLKKGVVPHKFQCQQDDEWKPPLESIVALNTKRQALVETLSEYTPNQCATKQTIGQFTKYNIGQSQESIADDDPSIQISGAECHPELEDLEFRSDETIEETQFEDHRGTDCLIQENDMDIDIKLEDSMLLNYKAEMLDLNAKSEIYGVKEEPITKDVEDHEGRIDQHTTENKAEGDNVERLAKVTESILGNYQSNYKVNHDKRPSIPKTPSKVGIFKCAECSYEAIHKEDLKNHMLEHNSVICTTTSLKTRVSHRDFSTRELMNNDSQFFRIENKAEGDNVERLTKVTKSILGNYQSNYKVNHDSDKVIHKEDLKNHMQRVSQKDISKVKNFKCAECTFATKRKDCLRLHLLVHRDPSDVEIFQCKECSFKSKHKLSLRRHLLVHTDPSQAKMFKCNECSYETKRKDSLIQHQLLHKGEMFTCNDCSYQCRRKDYLKSHMLVHGKGDLKLYMRRIRKRMPIRSDPSRGETFICNECSFETKHKASLKSHALRHRDPSKLEMFKCNDCTFETKYKSCLRDHVRLHRDLPQLKKINCDKCSYRNTNQKRLRQHMLEHEDPSLVIWFRCDKCDFAGKRKDNLINHKLIHEDPSQLKMFKCTECNYETKRKADLKNHVHVHKGTSGLKTFRCHKCRFRTDHESILGVHMQVHKIPSQLECSK